MCLPVELRLLAVVKGLPSCSYSFRHTTWHLRAVRIPLPVPNTILHVQSSAWTHNQYKHVEWEQAFTFPATLLSFQNIHLSRTLSSHFSTHSSLRSNLFSLFKAFISQEQVWVVSCVVSLFHFWLLPGVKTLFLLSLKVLPKSPPQANNRTVLQ